MAYIMTQSDYAKHRGVNRSRVNRYVKQGKLTGSFIKKDGRVYIDPEKADALLKKNLDPMNPIKEPKIKNQKLYPHQTTVDEKKYKVQKAGLKGVDYQTARTINEQYKAALRKLEYEQKSGVLIPANEVERAWTSHITNARTRLLGIKSKVAPLIHEYLADVEDRESVLGLVDSAVREALEELSRSELE